MTGRKSRQVLARVKTSPYIRTWTDTSIWASGWRGLSRAAVPASTRPGISRRDTGKTINWMARVVRSSTMDVYMKVISRKASPPARVSALGLMGTGMREILTREIGLVMGR